MNNVKCPHCGLINWPKADSCKKCGCPLLASDPTIVFDHSAPPNHSRSFSKKWFLTIFVLAVPLGVWLYVHTRDQAIIAALQQSDAFNEPITVEVYKQSDDNGAEGPNLEALTLREAGFMNIEKGLKDVHDPTYPWKIPPPDVGCSRPLDPATPPICPPPPDYGPHMTKVATVDFTFPAQSDVSDWKPFDLPRPFNRKGWVVPVGGRRLIQLTSVEWFTNTPRVYFTWTWEPNQVGRYFDSKDDPPVFTRDGIFTGNVVRRKTERGLNSSTVFRATAQLVKNSSGWEVKEITWH